MTENLKLQILEELNDFQTELAGILAVSPTPNLAYLKKVLLGVGALRESLVPVCATAQGLRLMQIACATEWQHGGDGRYDLGRLSMQIENGFDENIEADAQAIWEWWENVTTDYHTKEVELDYEFRNPKSAVCFEHIKRDLEFLRGKVSDSAWAHTIIPNTFCS